MEYSADVVKEYEASLTVGTTSDVSTAVPDSVSVSARGPEAPAYGHSAYDCEFDHDASLLAPIWQGALISHRTRTF